jgi:hypothetical protein
MKDELIRLIKESILFEYHLPHVEKGIEKSVISNIKDYCYKIDSDDNLAKIMHNSIIEYSFDSFEMNVDEDVLFNKALLSRIRYNSDDADETKLNYGFFGEVLLHVLLRVLYKAPPLISKGHFTIVGNGESKGYDSYHLVQKEDGTIHLWFGEVKFRGTSSSGLKSALDNLSSKILTDSYLRDNNLIPIFDEMSKNPQYTEKFKGSKIIKLRDKWVSKGIVEIEDLKEENFKLIYPILISYNISSLGYDKSIENAIDYIKKNYSDLKIDDISIETSIFFVFLPVNNVKAIKTQVLEWIDLREQLI